MCTEDMNEFKKVNLDLERLNKWTMSQSPEPECTGRCFGCHNSLCVNSLFPYEELERVAMEFKNDKDK